MASGAVRLTSNLCGAITHHLAALRAPESPSKPGRRDYPLRISLAAGFVLPAALRAICLIDQNIIVAARTDQPVNRLVELSVTRLCRMFTPRLLATHRHRCSPTPMTPILAYHHERDLRPCAWPFWSVPALPPRFPYEVPFDARSVAQSASLADQATLPPFAVIVFPTQI